MIAAAAQAFSAAGLPRAARLSFRRSHAHSCGSSMSVQGARRSRCLGGRRQRAAPVQARVTGEPQGDLRSESSALVNREVVLLLFQLELDQQLQRALNYETFDAAQEIRMRRQQVDEALKELQAAKGPGCGARLASKSDQMDLAPAILRLKMQMQEAVEQERYADAAALRDQLRPLEEQSRSVAQEAEQWQCLATAPKFRLGQMVVHASKGYRGVVCGWDGMCCEDTEWQAAAGVRNPNQVFYHLLVDVRDWPQDDEQPPVAYVGEDKLGAASSADFSLNTPLNGAGLFAHPYAYLLFLGPDGKGNMIPSRQLRDKYCVVRADVYSSDEETTSDEEDDGFGGGGGNGGNGGGGNGGGSGGFKIPGIDMSSLD